MGFGRKKSNALTGADYLFVIARDAEGGGHAYARDFRMMAESAFAPEDPAAFTSELIAQRPLRDYEQAPAAIVVAAHEAALSNKDYESAAEVVRVGAALIAKWPDYLISFGRHPRLSDRPDDSEPPSTAAE